MKNFPFLEMDSLFFGKKFSKHFAKKLFSKTQNRFWGRNQNCFGKIKCPLNCPSVCFLVFIFRITYSIASRTFPPARYQLFSLFFCKIFPWVKCNSIFCFMLSETAETQNCILLEEIDLKNPQTHFIYPSRNRHWRCSLGSTDLDDRRPVNGDRWPVTGDRWPATGDRRPDGEKWHGRSKIWIWM